MKKIKWALCIFLVLLTLGCVKKSVDIPEEVATKFAAPKWKADDSGKYPATMTAVVTLPVGLTGAAMENDELAAFVKGECRGLGVIVKVNNQHLYFVLIQGLSEEANKITFKYYSNKTSYMHESQPTLTFLVDATYGSAENPKTLELTQLK